MPTPTQRKFRDLQHGAPERPCVVDHQAGYTASLPASPPIPFGLCFTDMRHLLKNPKKFDLSGVSRQPSLQNVGLANEVEGLALV